MATTPGRSSRSAAPTASTAQRGIILVLVAVVIGAMLLVKGGGDQKVRAEGSEVLDRDSTEEGGGDETTTTEALVPPAELKVVVLNATGRSGVAKTKGQELMGKGYANTSWKTATATSPTSVVYFGPDTQAESAIVAQQFGLDPTTALAPLPNPLPAIKEDGGVLAADAQTVVIVGQDLAG
jgi:hypothetical protein